MRLHTALALAVGACAFAVGLALPRALDAAPPPVYYVVLGDSLSRGWQPDSSGHDRATPGYATGVWRALRRGRPGLRLVNFGCGGETTATMLSGTVCDYIAGSQLAQAEAFIESHPGAVAAVSVNIGDNDVEGCLRGASFDEQCVRAGYAAVRAGLPAIAARLRAAAGPHVPIVGLSDYDQFLALWLRGPQGRAAARRSVGVITHLNAIVQSIYTRSGIAVADAGSRFATTDLRDFTPLRGQGRVPVAVERICAWTWACSGPPIGFDDHANGTGYAVLARVILAAERRAVLTNPKSRHIPG